MEAVSVLMTQPRNWYIIASVCCSIIAMTEMTYIQGEDTQAPSLDERNVKGLWSSFICFRD